MTIRRSESLGKALSALSSRRSDAGSARLTRLKSRRKLWRDVHLWLGLALGLFLSVFGITGSILVFYEEINAVLEPALFTVEAHPGGERAFRPLVEILTAVEQQAPPGAGLNLIAYPPAESSTYRFFYARAVENGVERWQIFADPYRAVVTGKRLLRGPNDWLPCCMIPFIFELHYPNALLV